VKRFVLIAEPTIPVRAIGSSTKKLIYLMHLEQSSLSIRMRCTAAPAVATAQPSGKLGSRVPIGLQRVSLMPDAG